MTKKRKKKSSLIARLRNYFITGIIVLVPIGFTLYLTVFIISISSNLIPKEINPNSYLPFSIPGLEIALSIVFISGVKIGYIFLIVGILLICSTIILLIFNNCSVI